MTNSTTKIFWQDDWYDSVDEIKERMKHSFGLTEDEIEKEIFRVLQDQDEAPEYES